MPLTSTDRAPQYYSSAQTGRLPTPAHTPVCHANEQDVVEGVHSINLSQQLVDDGVMRAGAVPHAATLPADGINLIKDYYVQLLQDKRASSVTVCRQYAGLTCGVCPMTVGRLCCIHDQPKTCLVLCHRLDQLACAPAGQTKSGVTDMRGKQAAALPCKHGQCSISGSGLLGCLCFRY